MDLNLTDDQKLFQETTARFLADSAPLTAVRALEDDAAGFDSGWWRQGAELGWTSMLAPEALGGGSISGNAVQDLALAAYERGKMVAPGPFVPINAAIAMLAAAPSGAHDELIVDLMAGDAVAALGLDEPGSPWGPAGITSTVVSDGDNLIVNGLKAPVEAGGQATVQVIAVRADDGHPLLVLIESAAQGVTISPRNTVDLVRRYATVQLDDVRVPKTNVVAEGAQALDRCLDIANALQMAETVGALERVFDFTLEWAFDRHTFGRPLASYQELKHRFADMKLWLEGSKATVGAAVVATGAATSEATELVSAAKSYVSEHGPELVQDCVQMHGGIGVTWDHDIHLYLRRVTLNSSTYGTTRDHRERLASIILEGA
jgi:alkylation response protein AidB-like acyl-CoA dehydrogenase